MFTDEIDLQQLHQMASNIGMKRAWFQEHRIAPHYDLTPRRRAVAISLGAIEVDRRTASIIWAIRREAMTGSLMP